MVFAFFTAATVAAYVVGLLPLWFVARVRKASHAFWLATAAGLLSFLAFATGASQAIAGRLGPDNQDRLLLVTVFGLHLIFFSAVCVLYGRLARRG